MLEISFDLKGLTTKSDDSNFLTKLKERLETQGEFKAKLERALGEVMMDDLRKRFSSSPPTTTGGNVWGGEYWRQLSHSYLLQNPQRAQGRVYIDSGALMNSLTTFNPNLVSNFDQDEYSFGTRIPYADKLQEMRPIVFFHPTLTEKLSEAYIKLLLEEDGLTSKPTEETIK